MRTLLSILLCFSFTAFAQPSKKKVSWQKRIDLPQDTYVRLMHTADSLFEDYRDKPFDFIKEDGSCCDPGLAVIRGFYAKALVQAPGDEDADKGVAEVGNMIEDEHLLYYETDYLKVLAKGDQYFRNGEYEMALSMYYKASDLKPDSKPIKKKIKHAKKQIKATSKT